MARISIWVTRAIARADTGTRLSGGRSFRQVLLEPFGWVRDSCRYSHLRKWCPIGQGESAQIQSCWHYTNANNELRTKITLHGSPETIILDKAPTPHSLRGTISTTVTLPRVSMRLKINPHKCHHGSSNAQWSLTRYRPFQTNIIGMKLSKLWDVQLFSRSRNRRACKMSSVLEKIQRNGFVAIVGATKGIDENKN